MPHKNQTRQELAGSQTGQEITSPNSSHADTGWQLLAALLLALGIAPIMAFIWVVRHAA